MPCDPGDDGRDFLSRLREDAVMRFRDKITRGELLSAPELRARLGFSFARFSVALATGRIFAVISPSGALGFPAFLADPRYDANKLHAVVETLAPLSGAEKYAFLTEPAHSLNGRTPLEALEAGESDLVLRAAAACAHR
ncbi:hypothetical protein [Noviherbaspirillum pedocola]|uniref:Antitoxin Xre/MbcA/ParS-like toxin-binding domain-containing protein n=1 Tax=Noviherbaspirillum pedocola TaxID=2801341 RepID=A0A934SXP9_9BURK|nr:hypothetical protein [Noviherbaspirillum pedocola]MBK4738766.1 hypothetical protein [Noviherbaspirillum pedocola]